MPAPLLPTQTEIAAQHRPSEIKPWYSSDPDSAYAYWEPTNVKFEHDPQWRAKFWSIQAAHDRSHWGWKIVAAIVALAGGALNWTRFR
jgi:hypothetical protein